MVRSKALSKNQKQVSVAELSFKKEADSWQVVRPSFPTVCLRRNVCAQKKVLEELAAKV